jgi:rhodanese-related sulfurtransferase
MADELVASEKPVPDALEATRVTAEEVMARRQRGEPILFVDARAEDEWRRSDEKLPDALRLSLDRVVEGDTFPVIPRSRSIVTYCTSPHEKDSASAAKLLSMRGYSDVHPLYGGLEAWRRAGGELSPR